MKFFAEARWGGSVRTVWATVLLLMSSNITYGQPYGLTERLPNATLQMPQSLPVFGYALSNLQTGLGTLIMVATPPGETNRLFAVDRVGRILVITNLAVNSLNRPVFLNITNQVMTQVEHGLLGLAFHP